MSNTANIVQAIHAKVQAGANIATDTLEKVSTPASRAGSVIDRVTKMASQGVSVNVIAVQLTENSPNGHVYTPEHVNAFVNLGLDSQTKVIVTATQATALIRDQNEHGSSKVPSVTVAAVSGV
ncbi:TPA: hypothetical protein ACRZ2U_000426 [Vibrio harveyi]